MHRRFTLQMERGLEEPETASIYVYKGSAKVPVWRCSGCLMAQGVYRQTTNNGRPLGSGCEQCGKDEQWLPVNPLACRIDGVPVKRMGDYEPQHPLQPIMVAAVEGAILGGQWHRLTSSCEPYIVQAVSAAVRNEVTPWVNEQYGVGARKVLTELRFHYQTNTVTVTVTLSHPGLWDNSNTKRVAVRYRWVQ